MNRVIWMLPLLLWIGLAQANDISALQKKLSKTLPQVNIENLQAVKGSSLYQGEIGGQILYFTADGLYVLQGDLISLKTKTNLTQLRKVQIRKSILAKLDEKNMIIFGPKKADYTVTVFTDIDCVYCRKLHSQMKQYNDLGIRVRYLAFPRTGLNTKAYYDAVNVWCAKDPKQAMTNSFAGKDIAVNHCADNPVAADYQLGQKLEVEGTPSIFLESGRVLPGYLPPKRLKAILQQASSK